MKESRRFTFERGHQDGYQRVVLEQEVGQNDVGQSLTPKWDKVINGTKEGVAHYGSLFCRSFVGAIVPTFVIMVCILVIMWVFAC